LILVAQLGYRMADVEVETPGGRFGEMGRGPSVSLVAVSPLSNRVVVVASALRARQNRMSAAVGLQVTVTELFVSARVRIWRNLSAVASVLSIDDSAAVESLRLIGVGASLSL
jgi:hypothetical protein